MTTTNTGPTHSLLFGSVPIVTLGIGLVVLGVQQAVRYPLGPGGVSGPTLRYLPPVLLGAGLVAGGIWLLRRGTGRRSARSITAMTIAGTVVGGLLTGLAVVSPTASGFITDHAMNILLVGMGLGANAGMLVGIETYRNRHRVQQIQQTEETLEFLQRILRHNVLNASQIIMGYAHELRTMQETSDPSQSLSIIEQQGGRIATLVDNVQDLAIIETGNTELVTVEVGELVEEILDSTERSFSTVRIERSIEPVVITGDEYLAMALRNVIENAIVHNDTRRPIVRVTVEKTDEGAAITVADNGPGIDAEQQASLFDRGEHGDAGLGLYLADRIVTNSNGSIEISNNEFGGTTVRLQFTGGHPATGSEPGSECYDEIITG